MKINKTVFVGFICIIIAGIIFLTDALNPIIRPLTYLFLMGSSKGKDMMFFTLLGFFIIFSQLFEKEIDSEKYLRYSIVIASVLLILGILIEVLFRFNMNIPLNTIFASMTNGMSSTSILHTHLLKSILGEVLTNLAGPLISSDINTGVGLYQYVPGFAKLVILLIPIFAVTSILANQNRTWVSSLLISFFSSCLIIGAIDGGLFSTPALFGIFGLGIMYRDRYYVNYYVGIILKDKKLLEQNEKDQPKFRNKGFSELRFLFNRFLVYIIVVLIIVLRFTIAIAGAEPDYYTVTVEHPAENLEIPDIPVEKISRTNESVTYRVNPDYDEIELLNMLKIPLNNSCEYYTVSWNIYPYLIQWQKFIIYSPY